LYEFHHDYMLPMYHEKCKVMYTDTDSLIYLYRVRRCMPCDVTPLAASSQEH